MNDVNHLPTYQEEVAQYTKKDAIYALLFFAVIMFFSIVPILPRGTYVNLAFTIVLLVALFVFLKIKGQGLRSIGLHFMDWKKAFAAGLFFMAVFLMLKDGLLPGLIGGWQMQSVGALTGVIALTLIQAFYEDVIHIGYIQTRLYGLIKNDYLAVFVGAVIFAVSHFPWHFRMAIASDGGVGFGFLSNLALLTIMWVVFHVFANIIFRNLHSIIPVTLFHFSWNLSRGRLWLADYGNGFNESLSIGIAFGSVFLVVWVVLPFLKKRKVAK